MHDIPVRHAGLGDEVDHLPELSEGYPLVLKARDSSTAMRWRAWTLLSRCRIWNRAYAKRCDNRLDETEEWSSHVTSCDTLFFCDDGNPTG